jgi:hypothetical protein
MIKKENLVLLISMLLLAPTAILSSGMNLAYATATTVIYVDPSLVSGVAPNGQFTVSVKIANVTNLYAFDIILSWNPSILKHVSHQVRIPVATYPDGVLHEPYLPVRDTVNDTSGTYNAAFSSMAPAPSFNGSGTVFTITFKVLAYGQSALAFTSVKLANHEVPPTPIPFETHNGNFVNFVPPPAKLYVDPNKIFNASLVPPKNFSIDIKIKDLYWLSRFEFWLAYNTSILDTALVTVKPPFTSPITQIFEDQGKIRVGGSTTTISGNLTLATITFNVTKIGETAFHLYNVTLINDMGNPITYDPPVDGYFNNLLLAKLYVYPHQIIDPTMVPGSVFTIEIKMQGAADFYGYEFTLDYDPKVIACVGVIIVPPNNDTNYNTTIEANSALGRLLVNVSYYVPAQPLIVIDPTTVETIYFQVKSYGLTVLDLHNIKFVDKEGKNIPRIEDGSEDGLFATLTADVAILRIDISKNKVYPNRNVTISVVAGNVGDLPASFNVTVFRNATKISTQSVPNLLPHQNVTLTFLWNTTGLTPGNNFTISAEASHVQYEINFANNRLVDGFVFIKMLGDLDGNRVIDIYDVTAATIAYDSKVGDPLWNEDADLAPPYGIIDIYDVVTIASQYGKTY